jgi:hypothetical protein
MCKKKSANVLFAEVYKTIKAVKVQKKTESSITCSKYLKDDLLEALSETQYDKSNTM